MKSFKLFKRLSALITAVAVLASMGTAVFATETETAPTITIGSVTIAPDDGVAGQGLYTITVPYTVDGTIGSKGVTMLAYTKGSTSDSLVAGESFTQYKSDYKIAYVTQEAPADSISFKIDTTGAQAMQVGAGEKILVLLGGDGVVAPASALVTTYWEATGIAIKEGDGDAFGGFTETIEVDLGAGETPEIALKEALSAYDIFVTDGQNEAEIDWNDDTDITVVEATAQESSTTHKAVITVGTDVELEGAYVTAPITHTIFFNAASVWTANALSVTPDSFRVYKDAIAAAKGVDVSAVDLAMITEAVEAEVKAATIKAVRNEPALEAVLTAAEKVEKITVTLTDAGFDGSSNDDNVAFDVALGEGTYGGEAKVGAEGVKTTVTVNYQLVSPSAWEVATATYAGEIAGIEETKASDFDFEAYAEAELDGKTVTLADGEGNTADVVLGEDVEFTVSAVVGDPNESDIAEITVTVTIAEDEIEKGITTITIPAGITFTTTFTSKMETVKYGDVNEDGEVDVNDAILIWQNELGRTNLTAKQQKAANVNGDDGVDTNDAILIWQFELGRISSFPVEQ